MVPDWRKILSGSEGEQKMAIYKRTGNTFTRTRGFTIIELMIVIAIISIILVIAVPVYQQYTARAKITEGMSLSASLITGISEYYQTNNQWPADNSAAGGAQPAEYETDIVETIEVSASAQDGTITITYKPSAIPELSNTTNTLIYIPSVDASRNVSWNCDGGSLPDWARPSRCR